MKRRISIVYASSIILGLVLTGQSLAKIDPETIVGMWLFDEGTGEIARDASGNGNDGELMNGPKWVAGEFGEALEFDGSDDWVNMGDAPVLKPTGDVTFTAWYYWMGGNYLLSTGGQTSSTGYAITHDPGAGTIWVGVSTGEKAANTGYIPGPSQEVWHHVAGSYDDSEGRLTVYVDGEVLETVKAGEKALENKFAALHIGKPNNVDNYYLSGIIDEVAIFNVALNQDDITSIMTRGLEGATAVSPSGKLAAAWGVIKVQL
jgi:hypothetical protein